MMNLNRDLNKENNLKSSLVFSVEKRHFNLKSEILGGGVLTPTPTGL